jgi:GTPase SAR1 family protein
MDDSDSFTTTNINHSHDYTFKIIIIGDPCCGKTSLLLRVTENKWNDKYEITVGVDCKSKTFNF